MINEDDNTTPLSPKSSAWFIGLFYGLLVGWSLPVNFQATILLVLLTAGLSLQIHREKLSSRLTTTLCGIGLANALGFTLISNYRIQSLHWLVGYTLIVYFCILLRRDQRATSHGLSFAYHMTFFPFRILSALIDGATWRSVCSFRSRPARTPLDATKLAAFIVSIFVLALSAVMLSEVNDNFRVFVESIIQIIWDFIYWLIKLQIIESSIAALLVALFSYKLFTMRAPQVRSKLRQGFQLSHYIIIVIPLLVLLFAFCCFQAEFISFDPRTLSYLLLSQYVRKGFFELLQVAVLGALIWYLAERTLTRESDVYRPAQVLFGIFALELLALTIFSHHKLLTQQIIFGLRDQRILASAGVLLLSLTFIGFVAILLRKLHHSRLLHFQIFSLIAVTLVFSYGNLDSFITKTYPLRFEHMGAMHDDHAYLLTNSYDNSAHWLSVMDEVEKVGVLMPNSYYWGVYEPLCYPNYRKYDRKYHSSFRRHTEKLERRYGSKGAGNPRQVFQFNLREYLAFRFLQDRESRIERFQKFVEKACRRHTY